MKFPEKIPLGKILKAMVDATNGRGFQGRGLLISATPSVLRDPSLWSKSVTIVAQDAPIGASLVRLLQPLGLAFRVLSDGNVLIMPTPKEDEPDPPGWNDDYPLYRSTYSRLWHDYVRALRGMAEPQRRKQSERAAPAHP